VGSWRPAPEKRKRGRGGGHSGTAWFWFVLRPLSLPLPPPNVPLGLLAHGPLSREPPQVTKSSGEPVSVPCVPMLQGLPFWQLAGRTILQVVNPVGSWRPARPPRSRSKGGGGHSGILCVRLTSLLVSWPMGFYNAQGSSSLSGGSTRTLSVLVDQPKIFHSP
jgi:hypothetical protein